jgi:hypothetical protein
MLDLTLDLEYDMIDITPGVDTCWKPLSQYIRSQESSIAEMSQDR